METYTKMELLEAQGPFYAASDSWRRKLEEWVAPASGVMKAVTRSPGSRTAPHRYDAEEAYILAVLFKLHSIDFASRRLRDVATILHNVWHDPDHPAPAFADYWQAAKYGGEPESYRSMDRRGHADPSKRKTIAEDTPAELVIGLIPDDGAGFGDDELSVVVGYGSASVAPSGCQEIRINLTELFRAVKLPERSVDEPRAVGRNSLAPIARSALPVTALPVAPTKPARRIQQHA
jgi:hypothetical protein